MYVAFNALSLLMFIPFLNIIFNAKKTAAVTTKPDFSFTVDYLEGYFNYTMGQYVPANDPVQSLVFICVMIGILFFLKNLFGYLAMFFLSPVRNGVVKDLREALYEKLVTLPLGYYSDEKKGDVMSRVTNDVQEVQFSMMSALELVFREPFSVVLSLFVLFSINAELTIFSLILMPISALAIGRIGKSLKRTSKKGQDQLGELISKLEETLSGLRIIKAFNAEKFTSKSFDSTNRHYTTLMIRAFRKRDLVSPLGEFMGAMVMVTLVWFGGSLVLEGDGSQAFNGSVFITYIIMFSQLLRPLQGIANAYAAIQKGMASVDRVNEILNAKDSITEIENPKTIAAFSEKVEYRNVTFSYDNEPVLKNINFTLEKGKTIALVGQSGSGKSTLADLLPRFWDATEGEILIDGIKITDLTVKSLRDQLGIVTQESILFNDSVFDNITFGTPNATKEQVMAAAKIANAHEFISELENGYETNIGDRGSKLSGGQRQRVSIARAILANPSILILDEATSALDTESEKLVQEALMKLMESRTSLVIAHRLSTIQYADEILVLQHGEVVERGTHADLVAKKGVYKKLYDMQSF